MLSDFFWDPVYTWVCYVKRCATGRIAESVSGIGCLDDCISLPVFLSDLAILVVVNSSCVFTDSSQVFDMKIVNISATSLTLTWKINDNESSSVYTYKIQVVGETNSFNLTVQETHAVITALSSSTLYNITVYPFLDDGSEGIPGFIQVYTRESTHGFASLSFCWLCVRCKTNSVFSFKGCTVQCVGPRGLLPPSRF